MENRNLPVALTLKDLCTTLKIGQTKAYELVKSNAFPVVKIGSAIRIPSEPFFQWLHSGTNMK